MRPDRIDRRPRGSGPLAGLGYLSEGFSMLRRPGVKRYVAVPLLVNIALFVGAILTAKRTFEALMLTMTDWLPSWLDWLQWPLWILFGLTALLLVFYTFNVIANIIAAPFNGYLAARVEYLVTGVEPPSVARSIAAEVWLQAVETVRRLIYMAWVLLAVFIVTLLMGLSAVLAPAVPVLWFVAGAWLLAIEYGEYPMTNHDLRFKTQKRRLRHHGTLTMSFGGFASLMLLVPGLNLFVMPAAVAGATLAWLDHWRDDDPHRLS